MDEKRLQEIEERVAKATPGPWRWVGLDAPGLMLLNAHDEEYILWPHNAISKPDFNLEDNPQKWWQHILGALGNKAESDAPNNAAFIAASRQDNQDLLAEVKLLRRLLGRVLEEGQIAFDLRLEIEGARK